MNRANPFEGLPPGPPATLPRLEFSALAFLLDPVHEPFDEELALARLQAAGVDLDTYFYDYDIDSRHDVVIPGEPVKPWVSKEKGRTATQFVVGHGDLRWLPVLKAAGADIGRPDSHGMSPIGLALCSLHDRTFEAVDVLLALSVDIDAFCSDPDNTASVEPLYSPLMLAARFDDENMIRALVARGADVNRHASEAIMVAGTPLMEAIHKGASRACQVLLALGADANCKDRFGCNALWHAVQLEHGDMVVAMLESGCEPFVSDGAKEHVPLIEFCEGKAGSRAMAQVVRSYFAASQARRVLNEIDGLSP